MCLLIGHWVPFVRACAKDKQPYANEPVDLIQPWIFPVSDQCDTRLVSLWHLRSLLTRLFVQKLPQANHKEIIKPYYWPFVAGNHPSLVDSPHKGRVLPCDGVFTIRFDSYLILSLSYLIFQLASLLTCFNAAMGSVSQMSWCATARVIATMALMRMTAVSVHQIYLWPLLLTWFNFSPSMDK